MAIILTQAETEMIELNRQKAEIENKENKIKLMLEYEKRIETHINNINHMVENHRKKQDNIVNLFKVLCTLGVQHHITLETSNRIISDSDYITRELNDIDIFNKEVITYQIKTKWGNINSVTNTLSAPLPYGIKSQSRDYKPKTIADKILDEVRKEQEDKISISNIEKAKNDLIKYFEGLCDGVVLEFSKEYRKGYGRKESSGYYVDICKVTFANTSWMKISFTPKSNWYILDKFDHKMPKFETNHDWVTYLDS